MRTNFIIKNILTIALSMVMTLGAVSVAWAGNVYGDDGSHIKIMTSAGESTSLPKTNFNGMQVSLLPADTKIWISSEGSTANASTIFFYHGICEKDTLTDLDRITDTRLYGEYVENPMNTRRLEFDKHFSAFEDDETGNSVYVILFEDTEDFSWQRFIYMLDDGSYPIISTEQTNETLTQPGRDYTHTHKNAESDSSTPNIDPEWQNIDSDGIAHGPDGDKPGVIWLPDCYMSGKKIGFMG